MEEKGGSPRPPYEICYRELARMGIFNPSPLSVREIPIGRSIVFDVEVVVVVDLMINLFAIMRFYF